MSFVELSKLEAQTDATHKILEVSKPWNHTSAYVCQELKTSTLHGLDESDVADRNHQFGFNVYEGTNIKSFWKVFTNEVKEPMILMLLAVGVLYAILGEWQDIITIFIVVIMVVFLEVHNEYKAKKAVGMLSSNTPKKTTVRRQYSSCLLIDNKDIVPGDIMYLVPGQRIAADARLIHASSLQVDESSLTGESTPILKNAASICQVDTQLQDCINMVFAGTVVTQGNGLAVVTSIGMSTKLGEIKGMIKSSKPKKTETQKIFSKGAQRITIGSIVIIITITLIGWLHQGQSIKTASLTALSLAFVAIPEELPILVSIILAIGARSLAEQGVLIKELRATEALANVTTLLTDKTGTLTHGSLSFHGFYSPEMSEQISIKSASNQDLYYVLKQWWLSSSYSGSLMYDAFDKGVVSTIESHVRIDGEEKWNHFLRMHEEVNSTYPLAAQQVFSHESRFSSCKRLKETQASHPTTAGEFEMNYQRGAPEYLIPMCKHYRMHQSKQIVPLSEQDIKSLTKIVSDLAEEGYRLICVTSTLHQQRSGKYQDQVHASESYIFIGLYLFEDPVRTDVNRTVQKLQDSGLTIHIVTGDHPNTAFSVAQKVGLSIGGKQSVVTGVQFQEMEDEEIDKLLCTNQVFARMTPEMKFRTVQLLQRKGEIVVVTGDGVNDAPALREANVGIAMGSGTDLAKESASCVFVSDDIHNLTYAIQESRRLRDNLFKAIAYYLATKVGVVFLFLFAVLFGHEYPLSPIHIIILEMFLDFAAGTVFLSENSETGIMKSSSQSQKGSIFHSGAFVSRIMLGGLLLFISSLICYLVDDAESSADYEQDEDELHHAQTRCLVSYMVACVYLAVHYRTWKDPLIRHGIFTNRYVLLWGIAVLIFSLISTFSPFLYDALKMYRLSGVEWIHALFIPFAITFPLELKKCAQYYMYRSSANQLQSHDGDQ